MPEAPKESEKPADFSVAENNKKKLEFIEDVTRKADDVQKRVLSEILSRNAHVEYLQRYNLHNNTDRETFKKTMPVISYEDILPDINRIANGDKSPILCHEPISEFLTRSLSLSHLHTNSYLILMHVLSSDFDFDLAVLGRPAVRER